MVDGASSGPGTGSILQLKVRLLGLSPMVWRRVLLPELAPVSTGQVGISLEA